MRKNGSGFGCAGKTVESQVPLCVRDRERGREWLAPRASSPMLALRLGLEVERGKQWF